MDAIGKCILSRNGICNCQERENFSLAQLRLSSRVSDTAMISFALIHSACCRSAVDIALNVPLQSGGAISLIENRNVIGPCRVSRKRWLLKRSFESNQQN